MVAVGIAHAAVVADGVRLLDGLPDQAIVLSRATRHLIHRLSTLHGEFLCVHGTPRRPINEYLFPEDAINSPVKMQQIFERVDKYCLVGHTHVPGVFTDEPDFYPPDDLDGVYRLNEHEKAIVNPGSVGQPRDMDPRASYAILTDEQVEFFRLDYDVETVAQRIFEVPELSDWLGERLREGR